MAKNRGCIIAAVIAVVVLGLIAALVGVAIVIGGRLVETQLDTATQAMRASAARAQIAAFRSALELFEMDNGRYPTEAEGLDALITAPPGAVDYPPSGYLRLPEIPLDPWRNRYVYRLRPDGPDGKPGPVVTSYGEDGLPGGEGPAADISSDDEDGGMVGPV